MKRAAIAILTLLALAAPTHAAPTPAPAAKDRSPFDPSWSGIVLIWDYKKNPLECHDEPATLVGEDRRKLQVGVDKQGQPVLAEFVFLTYRCAVEKHEIRIWQSSGNMVREVACHSKVATNKGWDKEADGHKVLCKEAKHAIVLRGAAHE